MYEWVAFNFDTVAATKAVAKSFDCFTIADQF